MRVHIAPANKATQSPNATESAALCSSATSIAKIGAAVIVASTAGKQAILNIFMAPPATRFRKITPQCYRSSRLLT